MKRKGGIAGMNLCNSRAVHTKQPANWQDIVGKKIQSVDQKMGANVVKLHFTDGTSIVIDTEAIGHGLYVPAAFPTDGYGAEKAHTSPVGR